MLFKKLITERNQKIIVKAIKVTFENWAYASLKMFYLLNIVHKNNVPINWKILNNLFFKVKCM